MGAGGDWGVRGFSGRTRDFSISAPPLHTKVRPLEGGRERSKRRGAWKRTQEAIKTPPFGLTTKN